MLARILAMFDDDRARAMRYCLGVATRFPQFASEFTEYANVLRGE